MSSPVMVPMIAPDGTIGDVPAGNVGQAMQAGLKLGVEMVSPKGKAGVIPIENASDASRAGFTLRPPPMPQPPQIQMKPSYMMQAMQNTPSISGMENPGNMPPHVLNQMQPDDARQAQALLFTGAASTIPAMAAENLAAKGFTATLKQLATAKGKEEMMMHLRELALKSAARAVEGAAGVGGGMAVYKHMSK